MISEYHGFSGIVYDHDQSWSVARNPDSYFEMLCLMHRGFPIFWNGSELKNQVNLNLALNLCGSDLGKKVKCNWNHRFSKL